MAEAGFHLAGPLVKAEPHSRHDDPFEPALQNRWEAAPPGGIHEHDHGGPLDQVGMFGDYWVEDRLVLVVRRPFRLAHRGTKAERVQVEECDLIAGGAQAGFSPCCQRVSQAVAARVGDDDQGEHGDILAQPAAPCQLIAVDRVRTFSRRLLLQRRGRHVDLTAA